RKFLYLVVNSDGERAGSARDVATDHENDAELADSVRKAQSRRRHHRVGGKREQNRSEGAETAGTKEPGLFDERFVDGTKPCGERLHRERQAIDDGSDDKPRKRKGEWMTEEARREAAETGMRPEKNQKIESEDGRRQKNRKRGDRFDKGAPWRPRRSKPPGERNPNRQQQQCR